MNADTDKLGKIYFISEAMHTPDTSDDDILDGVNVKYETCFKIGFSTNLKNRLVSYYSDTPRYRIHFVIDNATEEDEKRLHKYFSKYSREDLNGREWFIENKEMVKFFREHKTIEEIRAIIPELKKPDRSIKKNKKVITPVINIMVKNGIGYKKEDFKGIAESSIINLLLNKYVTETQYYKDIGEFMEFLKSNGDINEEEFGLILSLSKLKDCEDLQIFNLKTKFTDKMRYLCEVIGVKFSKDELGKILDCIPLFYRNAYTILGPVKLKSLSYQKSKIEDEYRVIKNNQECDNDLDKEIFKTFTVGNKYTKESIKSKIGEIYLMVGYKAKAKANDIEKWFEVKSCLIPNKETGKRDNGFYLTGLKTK